jgi:hypothetical protein
MENLYEQVLDLLSEVVSAITGTAIPEVVVGVFVAAFVVVQAIDIYCRGSWATLSPSERLALVGNVCREAIEMAEWAFNYLEPETDEQKMAIGQAKLALASEYADQHLKVAGASLRDRQSVPNRIEFELSQINMGKVRYD